MTEEIVEFPDQGPMLQAVGKGIQVFASAELAMNFCFASMLGLNDRKRAIAAINAVRRFEERLRVVDAVADVSLDAEQRTTWRNLSCRLGKRAEIRNKIAHWMVSVWPGIQNIGDAKNCKIVLVPPVWTKQHVDVMWNNGNETGVRPITLKQLEEFHDLTNKLVLELFNFSQAIKRVESGDENPPYVSAISIGE